MTTKRATSKDVAYLAGVSRTTVSLILNNHARSADITEGTRQRVMEAARVLDYWPNAAARSLVRRHTNIIGFVLCQSQDRLSADAFLPKVLEGVFQVARERKWHVILESVPDVSQPDAYIGLVRSRQIDGIILSGPRSDDSQLSNLQAEGFPIVLLGQLAGAEFPQVDVDNVAGARHGVEHLIHLGQQRIACITNAPLAYTAAVDRLAGYRAALEDAGIPYDESLVRHGDLSPESGRQAMMDLLSHPEGRPGAVFVASDVVAVGALTAIREQGLRVPEDLAIVGFDDIPFSRFLSPPLTTVRIPAVEEGMAAAHTLAQVLAGKQIHPAKSFLPTELVVRASCGADGWASDRHLDGCKNSPVRQGDRAAFGLLRR